MYGYLSQSNKEGQFLTDKKGNPTLQANRHDNTYVVEEVFHFFFASNPNQGLPGFNDDVGRLGRFLTSDWRRASVCREWLGAIKKYIINRPHREFIRDFCIHSLHTYYVAQKQYKRL
jgi:hypothetical protein